MLSGRLVLADRAADVPFVDAIELVRGGEAHRLYDVVHALAASESPSDLVHSRILYRLVERATADLRKAQLRKLALRKSAQFSALICAVPFWYNYTHEPF